jgi:hypothetical protein
VSAATLVFDSTTNTLTVDGVATDVFRGAQVFFRPDVPGVDRWLIKGDVTLAEQRHRALSGQ